MNVHREARVHSGIPSSNSRPGELPALATEVYFLPEHILHMPYLSNYDSDAGTKLVCRTRFVLVLDGESLHVVPFICRKT